MTKVWTYNKKNIKIIKYKKTVSKEIGQKTVRQKNVKNPFKKQVALYIMETNGEKIIMSDVREDNF